jgi:ABC-type amino acid transport system permease subunit
VPELGLGAYVYRAGIESVHESQNAAARSLGLTRWQSMRFVILPQAVRRVIPPLLNDFIGLQKDTALVSVLGSIEAARAAQIYGAPQFNYASYVVAALLFVLLAVTAPQACRLSFRGGFIRDPAYALPGTQLLPRSVSKRSGQTLSGGGYARSPAGYS